MANFWLSQASMGKGHLFFSSMSQSLFLSTIDKHTVGNNLYIDSSHAVAVLEGVWVALERPPKVGMHLVLPLAALVDERDLEQRAHIGAFAGQGYEERDVDNAILAALPIGVEVDRPIESPHVEGLGGDELPQLGSGVRDRRRGGRRRGRMRCGGAMGGQSKPKLLIIAWDPL